MIKDLLLRVIPRGKTPVLKISDRTAVQIALRAEGYWTAMSAEGYEYIIKARLGLQSPQPTHWSRMRTMQTLFKYRRKTSPRHRKPFCFACDRRITLIRPPSHIGHKKWQFLSCVTTFIFNDMYNLPVPVPLLRSLSSNYRAMPSAEEKFFGPRECMLAFYKQSRPFFRPLAKPAHRAVNLRLIKPTRETNRTKDAPAPRRPLHEDVVDAVYEYLVHYWKQCFSTQNNDYVRRPSHITFFHSHWPLL